MNSWMTKERREIARQYVHDMINSFVDDPQGAGYHEEYDPPYVSFYSPDIGQLLEKACHDDKYSVCHPQFDVLHDPHNEIYDIEGHRVFLHTSGTIDISINGVAYDQNELTKWNMEVAKASKANKFHVRLPPK